MSRLPAHMQSAEALAALGVDTSTLRARQRARQQMEYGNGGVILSTSQQTADDANPWRRIVEKWEVENYRPTSPSDKRRCERIRAQADARDREIAAARQAALEQTRREESPVHERAKAIYVSHVNGSPAQTPEQAAHYSEALGHLKRGEYTSMMNALERVTSERLAQSDADLEDIRRRKADMDVEHARREMEHAQIREASVEVPPHMLEHPMD